MHKPLLSILAAALLPLLWSAPAHAEINIGESIEWIVADADLVVRAKVLKVHQKAGRGVSAKLAVIEKFKGPAIKGPIVVSAPAFGSLKNLNALEAAGTEAIFALIRTHRLEKDHPARASGRDWVLRDSHGDFWAASLGKVSGSPVFTMGFDSLTDPAAILKAVRASSTVAYKGRAKVVNIDAPFGTAAGDQLYAGSAVWLLVPIDDRLAVRAQGWIKGKETGQRVQGVQILSNFKSAAHIALLRGLMTDTDTWRITTDSKTEVRYCVREAAWKVLEGWGVSVPKPVFVAP